MTVNSISEPVTPELTDEWVDSTFGTGDDVHTVEALRTYFSDALYDQNLEDAIMDSLLPPLRICPARCPATTPACS